MEYLKIKFKDDIYRTGIYKISAKYDNSLFYIGLASRLGKYNCDKGFYSRWKTHVYQLNKNIHSNRFLQRIYNKYTRQCLNFEILEFCSPENCPDREIFYINELKPSLNLYNNKYCRTNYKVSYETKCKISKSLIGRKHTEATKQKMRISNKLVTRVTSINISPDILTEIKELILNKNFTKNKITNIYGYGSNRVIRNLNEFFNDSTLIDKLVNNKTDYSIRKKPKNKKKIYPISKILYLYKNGYYISEIRKIVKMNDDLIGKLIRENMSVEEYKKIRSINAKRK